MPGDIVVKFGADLTEISNAFKKVEGDSSNLAIEFGEEVRKTELEIERLGGTVDSELKPLINDAIAAINKGVDEKFEREI